MKFKFFIREMKNKISTFLRKTGLIKCMDKIHFYLVFIKSYQKRKSFKKANPDVILPPAYFIYETFGLDYYQFYNASIETASWLISYFEKHKSLFDVNILDWGCGPGRVIRHIPTLLDKSCRCYGTDYNVKYVEWCSKYIQDVEFKLNSLEPPLLFEDNKFDVIYGISIFTHLSEKMHYAWFNELIRVLRPGGILFLTLHGNSFKTKLSSEDKQKFDDGQIVVLSSSKEGHRTYGAFHPVPFVKELAGNNNILEFVEGDVIDGKPQQDIWIFQKNK